MNYLDFVKKPVLRHHYIVPAKQWIIAFSVQPAEQ